MKSKIGDKIRHFRGQHGMTQEQLAEQLGISHQSVSKWESGATIPDVMLFPELARIFQVSIDDIFGYVNSGDVQDVQNILMKIEEEAEKTDLPAAEKVCRDGLQTYPNSPELICKMAVILKTKYLIAENKEKAWLEESIALCNRVLHISSDVHVRQTAYKTKAISQAYKGDKLSAIQTSENVIHDYDFIMVYLTDGAEKIKMCKTDIEAHLQIIRKMLRLIAKVYRNQGNAKKYRKYRDASVSLSIDLKD